MVVLFLMASVCATAQNEKTIRSGQYTIMDLSTGQQADIYYDTVSWRMMNRSSKVPLDYYIIRYNDASMRADTVHGATGIIVNGLVSKNATGAWTLNEQKVKWDGKEWKSKDATGRKVKWSNGEMKVKDWKGKTKSATTNPAASDDWTIVDWHDHM